MAKKKQAETKALDFFKYDPVADAEKTFNIDLALNQNWDKTKAELERLGEAVDNVDVSWNGITGKPETFPPSPHTHTDMYKYIDLGDKASNPNDIIDNGIYRSNSWNKSQLHSEMTDGQGLLQVFHYSGSDTSAQWLKQIFISPHNGKMTERYKSGAGWSAWKYTTDEGNADKLDGKHASDFASAHVSKNGYWGITLPNGSDAGWLRTPSLGLLPFAQGGGASAGSLGTSSWKFNEIHGVNIFANGVNLGTELANIKATVNSAGKVYMPQGSAKVTFPNPPKGKGDVFVGKITCKYGGYIAVQATFLDKVSHVTGMLKTLTLRSSNTEEGTTIEYVPQSVWNMAVGSTYTHGGYKTVAWTSADNVATTETSVIRVEAGQVLMFIATGINSGESVITNIKLIYEEVAL